MPKMLTHLYKVPSQTWVEPGKQDGFQSKWDSEIKYKHNFHLIIFQLQLCLVNTIKRHFYWKKYAVTPLHISWTKECGFSLSTSCRKTVYFSPLRLLCLQDGWLLKAEAGADVIFNESPHGCPWHLPCGHSQCLAASQAALVLHARMWSCRLLALQPASEAHRLQTSKFNVRVQLDQ